MNNIFSAIILAIIFLFVHTTATAQLLKPTEIVYSRLPTDLSQPPNGANSPTIWAVGQDGANDRKITDGMAPRISDDGRFLLFRRLTCTTPNFPYCYNPYASQPTARLWVRDLANNTETMIFNYENQSRRLIGYYFSPESNQGNYQIILDYGDLIYKMNIDGTGATPLEYYFGTSFPRTNDTSPVLRRGDSLIALRSGVNTGLTTRTLGAEQPQNVPNTSDGDDNPLWSNDNQYLGFVRTDSQRGGGIENPYYPYYFRTLNKIKPDGTNRTILLQLNTAYNNSEGISLGGVWTNDNTKIIVAARINGVAGLYTVKTDGSGTYTRIPISSGNAPDYVGGIVQPRNEAQLISNGGGVMTDQNGNFSAKEDGTLEADIAQANQFSLVDSIAEPIAGEAMSGGSFSFTSGFVPNTPANIAGGTGKEGDVAGRPSGDGQILPNDVVQIQRFQIGLDQPFQSNEFQRADAAPFLGGGDGQILPNDVIQAQRYQIGLDQSQNAVGPVDFGASRQIETEEKSTAEDSLTEKTAAPRLLHIDNFSVSRGQNGTINILVDALGDEAAYGFNLNYDSAVLTITSAQIGTAGGGRLCNLTIAGQVRCSINNFPDNQTGSDTDQIGEIHVGNNQLLLKVNFMVAANASGGASSLTLSNVNASNDLAQLLTISGQDATVTVNAPTAANASASGRVLTANGSGIAGAIVTVIAQNGATRGILTDESGRFKFDNLESGETYIFKVAAKRFTFSQDTKVVAVSETIDGIDFVADGRIFPAKLGTGFPKR